MKVAAEHSGPKPGLQYAVGDGARRRDEHAGCCEVLWAAEAIVLLS